MCVCVCVCVCLFVCFAKVVDEMMPKTIINLSQNADFAGWRAKEHAPALLRSSLLYHQEYQRGLLGEEALQVQGLPVLSQELGFDIHLPWASALSQLTQKDMYALAGNSIHSQLAGELTLWTLAAVMPRETFNPFLIRPSVGFWDDPECLDTDVEFA